MSNLLKLYGERNTGLRTVTAPIYKQPSKLSQPQNTLMNLLTVTFLAIKKWTEINLRRLIVVEKRLTITANFQERGHEHVISQSDSRI